MTQAPREGLYTWTEVTDHSGRRVSLLWLSVRCRSCLSSGRQRSRGDPRRPVGFGRVLGSWVCVCLFCWTGHVSTPAYWGQGKGQLESLILQFTRRSNLYFYVKMIRVLNISEQFNQNTILKANLGPCGLGWVPGPPMGSAWEVGLVTKRKFESLSVFISH